MRTETAPVVTLALLVNAVELLCTAGLPALYTRILTLRELEAGRYYGYPGIYNAAYMLDDAVVLTVAVATLSRRRMEVGTGRWLKLISGAVMLVLGALLILRPGWLAI